VKQRKTKERLRFIRKHSESPENVRKTSRFTQKRKENAEIYPKTLKSARNITVVYQSLIVYQSTVVYQTTIVYYPAIVYHSTLVYQTAIVYYTAIVYQTARVYEPTIQHTARVHQCIASHIIFNTEQCATKTTYCTHNQFGVGFWKILAHCLKVDTFSNNLILYANSDSVKKFKFHE